MKVRLSDLKDGQSFHRGKPGVIGYYGERVCRLKGGKIRVKLWDTKKENAWEFAWPASAEVEI